MLDYSAAPTKTRHVVDTERLLSVDLEIMNQLTKILISLSLIFTPLSLLAQSASDLFNQGTIAYAAKDYTKAQAFYTQALEKDSKNSVILTNLALSEFQQGKKYLALGLLRKALSVSPGLKSAEDSLKFIRSTIESQKNSRQISTYETFRQEFLESQSLFTYFILSAMSFFAAGWTLISYFGRRKRAHQEEQRVPNFPFIAALLTAGCIAVTGLWAFKFYDSSILRATIIDEKVSLQTAPGDNQVSIMDLEGGLEVTLGESQDEWTQITTPNSTTGWIKKSSLLMTH